MLPVFSEAFSASVYWSCKNREGSWESKQTGDTLTWRSVQQTWWLPCVIFEEKEKEIALNPSCPINSKNSCGTRHHNRQPQMELLRVPRKNTTD
jgi:hypothetical protein